MSPFIQPGTVFSGLLDSTSILQLLAERFDPRSSGYSSDVNARRAQGVQSVSLLLGDGATARGDIPAAPAAPGGVATIPATRPPAGRPATTPIEKAFAEGASALAAIPAWTAKYPTLKG
jgi:phospholipase C